MPRELKIKIMNHAFPDEAVQCDEDGWLKMWEKVKLQCSGSEMTHSRRLACAGKAMAEFKERCRRRVTIRLEVPGFPPSTRVYASLDELPTDVNDDIPFELQTVPGAIFEMNVKCKVIITHNGRRWVLTKVVTDDNVPGFDTIDEDFSVEHMWVNGDYYSEEEPELSVEPELWLNVERNFLFKGKVVRDGDGWGIEDNGSFTTRTSIVQIYLHRMTQATIAVLQVLPLS